MVDYLPPNDTPWPSPTDQRSSVADTLQNATWPSLWPSTIHPYATEALRDADLAGLGSGDRAFAYVDALDAVTKWNGAAWRRLSPMSLAFGVTLDAYGIATVTHGLGYTPTAVNLTPMSPISGSISANIFGMCLTSGFTSTTFVMRGLMADGGACVGAVLVTGHIS